MCEHYLAALLTFGAPPHAESRGDWMERYNNTRHYYGQVCDFLYARMNYTPKKSASAEAMRKEQRKHRLLGDYRVWLREQGHEI